LTFPDEAALTAWLIDEATHIEEQDVSASFCIVTRTRERARRIAAAMRGKVACKLVLDGEFVFHRGVDVTTLENVKGLEFDYVVVADASEADYPATAQARRALYVCATRARHELALACVGTPSPMLGVSGGALRALSDG
jgi:DNA helicase IV